MEICRRVAQPGSALQWGCRGRRFKSSRADQIRFFFLPFVYYRMRPSRPELLQSSGFCCVLSIYDLAYAFSFFFEKSPKKSLISLIILPLLCVQSAIAKPAESFLVEAAKNINMLELAQPMTWQKCSKRLVHRVHLPLLIHRV